MPTDAFLALEGVRYRFPGRRIIDAAAETLELNKDKVLINLDRYGNTSAASIPIALDEALAAGRIQRGSQILISGFGAGLAWGTGILRW